MILIHILAILSASVWAVDSPPKNYLSEMLRMRDPFRKPEGSAVAKIIKSELEKFSVSELKMVGVSTGPTKMRALVSAPDGKNYFVAEGMKIGLRGGFVKKITPEMIQVREKIVNIIGEEENVDSEIRLLAESNFQLERRIRESGAGSERQDSNDQQGGNANNAFMNMMKAAIKAAAGGGAKQQEGQQQTSQTPQQSQQQAPAQQPAQQMQMPDWAKPQVLSPTRSNEFKPSLGGNKK